MNRQKNRFALLLLTSLFVISPMRSQEIVQEKEIEKAEVTSETVADTSATAEVAKEQEKQPSKAKKFFTDVADRIKLHGYAQAGYTYTRKANKDYNTFDLKRTLLWANAQIIDRWSFLFMHDFNSQVQEFYTDFRITRNNALFIRFGQFKNAYTLENPLSPTSMETIDVYSEGVTYLSGCGSDPLFGVQYGRDLGISLYGETLEQKLRYELQVMNGQGINKKDKNNTKDVIGRLEWRPVKGLNIVATGQIGRGHAVATSIYAPEIQLDEDYKRNRYSFGVDYKSTRFNIHGEYLEGKDDDVTSRGGYVTGSVALIPTKLDLIGSYDFFNFNTSLGMDQHKGVFGIQWWYFKRCRLQLQYVYKSAYTTADAFVHGSNHALMCQVQVRFN